MTCWLSHTSLGRDEGTGARRRRQGGGGGGSERERERDGEAGDRVRVRGNQAPKGLFRVNDDDAGNAAVCTMHGMSLGADLPD